MKPGAVVVLCLLVAGLALPASPAEKRFQERVRTDLTPAPAPPRDPAAVAMEAADWRRVTAMRACRRDLTSLDCVRYSTPEILQAVAAEPVMLVGPPAPSVVCR